MEIAKPSKNGAVTSSMASVGAGNTATGNVSSPVPFVMSLNGEIAEDSSQDDVVSSRRRILVKSHQAPANGTTTPIRTAFSTQTSSISGGSAGSSGSGGNRLVVAFLNKLKPTRLGRAHF